MGSRIAGLGACLPRTVVSNDFFRAQAGNHYFDDLGDLLEGCCERRHAQPDETAVFLGTQAAREAIENAKVDPAEIDFVLGLTVAPDSVAPPDISVIMKNVGITSGAPHWTMEAGCASFIEQLACADMLIKCGKARRVLVICGTNWVHRVIDKTKDYSSLGDGSAAVVVEACSEESLLAHRSIAFLKHLDMLELPAPWRTGKPEVCGSQASLATRKFFVDGTVVTPARECLLAGRRAGVSPDWAILSQPGIHLMETWMRNLELDMEKNLNTISISGHLSAANVPFILHHYVHVEPRIRRGDTILMFSPGIGGLAAAALWRY